MAVQPLQRRQVRLPEVGRDPDDDLGVEAGQIGRDLADKVLRSAEIPFQPGEVKNVLEQRKLLQDSLGRANGEALVAVAARDRRTEGALGGR